MRDGDHILDIEAKSVRMGRNQGEAGWKDTDLLKIDDDSLTSVAFDHEVGGMYVGEAISHRFVGKVASLGLAT